MTMTQSDQDGHKTPLGPYRAPKAHQKHALRAKSGKVIDDSKEKKWDDDEGVKKGKEKEAQDVMLNEEPMIKEGKEPELN